LIKIIYTSTIILVLSILSCSPEENQPESSVDSLSDLADGAGLSEKTCKGKYKPFAGIKPSESIFVGFSETERLAFDKAATAVPGFITYLYGIALEGRFVIDAANKICVGDQPCADFSPAIGEKGQYIIGFKPGEKAISSHLPFASAIAMLNMARATVVNGQPVMAGYPASVAAEMNAIKGIFLQELGSGKNNKLEPAELASLQAMNIDEFIAHGLDSRFCNIPLYNQDKKKFPLTMAKLEALIKGFDQIDAALQKAIDSKSVPIAPQGLSVLSERLFSNLFEAHKAVNSSQKSLGLTAWGKGGIGGASKVQVGTSPWGRRVFENPVRASGNGVLQSKANRPWVN
jgi:hypothetical protein